MQYLDHIRVLELASRGALPDQIDEQSELPIAVVRELVEARCLEALDASSMDGDAYLEPRITLKGREFLRRLQRETVAPERDLIATLERMRDIMAQYPPGARASMT